MFICSFSAFSFFEVESVGSIINNENKHKVCNCKNEFEGLKGDPSLDKGISCPAHRSIDNPPGGILWPSGIHAGQSAPAPGGTPGWRQWFYPQ